VHVDDVLVFLRRVLGEPDRAVGAPLEPLRMLLDPGVVGEHWMAKSSAISRPCAWAAASMRRKSSSVPSSGWMSRCPPSAEPMA
jgi:hypothetical protein